MIDAIDALLGGATPRTVVAVLLTLAGSAPSTNWPRQPDSPRPSPIRVTTDHTGVFGGQSVRYSATVAETIVPGPDGAPAASIVTTTYLRQDVANRDRRPVLFAFNGGPGASSSPLHFSAFGPRRYVTAPDGRRDMGDNPFSVLDAMDLVFIDPVGTGYSRPLPGVDGQWFWSVTGDAASVQSFIAAWLKANGREGSPRFLCGESYGTTRAAQIVSMGADLRFDGVLLLSTTGGPDGPVWPFVVLFPTFATTAAFHGIVPAAGRSVHQIFDEAARFARTTLRSALAKGARLTDAERERVAGEMARRIGLPASFIAGKSLRIGRDSFMLGLLKDRGLRTGQLDTRVTGRLEDFAGRHPPYDDPSMPGAQGAAQKPTAHLYFTNELQVPAADPYRTLNLDINARWRFDSERAMKDPIGLVGAAMRKQPRLRLFWVGGYYDLTTPLGSGRYILERAGVPAGRLTALAVPTGHMPYDGDENLARFVAAVRRFVTTSKA